MKVVRHGKACRGGGPAAARGAGGGGAGDAKGADVHELGQDPGRGGFGRWEQKASGFTTHAWVIIPPFFL